MTSVMKEGKAETQSARTVQFKGLLRAGTVLVVISIPALVTGVVEKNIAVEAAGLFGTIVGSILTGDSLTLRKNRVEPEKV